MENLDLSISKDGIELLKSLIGQKLISFMHEKTDNAIVFQKIEIFSSNGRYLIDNDVNWFDDYFSGPEDVPVLDFKKWMMMKIHSKHGQKTQRRHNLSMKVSLISWLFKMIVMPTKMGLFSNI